MPIALNPVDHNGVQTSGVTFDLAMAAAAGELLVAGVTINNLANLDLEDTVIAIPTDNGSGGAWQQAIQFSQPGSVRREIANCALFYKEPADVAGDETLLTFTQSVGTDARRWAGRVARFTGVLSSGALDAGSINSERLAWPTATAIQPGPTGIHQQLNNVVVSCCGIGDDDHTDTTQTNGFLRIFDIIIAAASEADHTMAMWYKIINDGASEDPTLGFDGGAEGMAGTIASFKDVDPGGGPSPSTSMGMLI